MYIREDNTPYYIGKGTGNRRFKNHGRPTHVPKDKNRIILYHDNLLEEDAFKLEKLYIKLFGKKCDGTGILHNISDGGEGLTSEEATKLNLKTKYIPCNFKENYQSYTECDISKAKKEYHVRCGNIQTK